MPYRYRHEPVPTRPHAQADNSPGFQSQAHKTANFRAHDSQTEQSARAVTSNTHSAQSHNNSIHWRNNKAEKMVNIIIGALKKLDCRQAKKDRHLEDQKFIHDVASDVSGTSGSSSSPEEINRWRLKATQCSVKSYMEGANQAYDLLHNGDANQPITSKYARPPIANVETTGNREENEPVSFITIDPTLREEDSQRPFKNLVPNTKENTSMISVITMDPSLQTTVKHSNVSGKEQQGIEHDPPGLRRVSYSIDENRPFLQENVRARPHGRQSVLSEMSEVVQEMEEFGDSESVLYSQFPNSFISFAGTSTVHKFHHQDPSECSLSDIAGYQFVEI